MMLSLGLSRMFSQISYLLGIFIAFMVQPRIGRYKRINNRFLTVGYWEFFFVFFVFLASLKFHPSPFVVHNKGRETIRSRVYKEFTPRRASGDLQAAREI